MATDQGLTDLVGNHWALPADGCDWQPITTGLSGNGVWRVACRSGVYCLRAFPIRRTSVSRLQQALAWQDRAAQHLDYVPRTIPTRTGNKFVRDRGCYWVLETWQSGQPLAPDADENVFSRAIEAVARLHLLWRREWCTKGCSSAVGHRLHKLGQVPSIIRRLPEHSPCPDLLAQPLYSQLIHMVRDHWTRAHKALAALAHRRVTMQPIHGDLWRAHVLLGPSRVTGIVDLAACRLDCPVFDLARLVASTYATAEPHRWGPFVQAYRSRLPLTPAEEELMQVLAWTGDVVAATNWLLWLAIEKRDFGSSTHVVRERVAWLVQRLPHLSALP